MVVRGCLLLLLLSSGSAFVLMPKNATGRVAGDLTLLYRYAYRWDMPEVPPPSPSAVTPSHLHITLTLATPSPSPSPSPFRLHPVALNPRPLPSRLLHLSLTFLIHHAAPAPLCVLASAPTHVYLPLAHRTPKVTRGSGAASCVGDKPAVNGQPQPSLNKLLAEGGHRAWGRLRDELERL